MHGLGRGIWAGRKVVEPKYEGAEAISVLEVSHVRNLLGGDSVSRNTISKQGMAYCLLVIPFLLRPLSDLLVHEYYRWLAIDYAVHAGALCAIGFLVWRKRIAWSDIGFGAGRKDVVLAGTMVVTALSFIVCSAYLISGTGVLSACLGSIPAAPDHTVSKVDKWFGLLLAAVSEEVVFRGLARSFFSKIGMGPLKTVLISAVVFALAFWSQSVGTILCFATLGALFMVSIRVAGSVVPSIVAHYVMLVLLYHG